MNQDPPSLRGPASLNVDTASMQLYGSPATPDGAAQGGTSAGLILLYAPGFRELRPAYLFTSAEVTIGRDPSATISVLEQAVSRRHARIAFCDGVWEIADLGSHNGTMVDGKFVTQVELEHLHEVRIGDAIFKFVAKGAENYLPYRVDGSLLGGAARRAPSMIELIGGYQIDRIAAEIERVAPTDLTVMVLGESGTGKEVVAREIHRLSGRRGALTAINCAAIPAQLLESELFGYKRGAFSGADRDKIGLIRAAQSGTLFLDEIGDMPMEAQVKLLRVLETREVYPVGATQGERIDVRVVCATHRDLKRLEAEGRFRGDLYARLNDYRVTLPPLRERKEDLYLLASHLLARHGKADTKLTFPFMTAVCHYDWPYNVRELDSTIKRAIVLADGPQLDAVHLSEPIREHMADYGKGHAPKPGAPRDPMPSTAPAAREARGVPSESQLRQLLELHRGNVAAVGRELAKERMQIHRWIKRYGIVLTDYRD